MIVRIGLLLFSIQLSVFAFAQKMHESKAQLSFENGYWVLKLETDYNNGVKVMQLHHPKRDLSIMSVDHFNNILSGYLDTSFAITRDFGVLPMKRFAYEVNSQKVVVKYISDQFEKPGDVIVIMILMCTELENMHVHLSVRTDEYAEKFELNAQNQFMCEIQLK